MTRFDEIRAANPELGFGLYALAPGGPVTLEIYTPDEQTFSFIGPTETAVLALAFPEPDPLDAMTPIEPAVLPPLEPNIFD